MELLLSWRLLVATLVGWFAGLLGGMTGLVLGPLRLPAIYAVLPVTQAAAGTNLGIDGLTAAAALFRYRRGTRIDGRALALVGVSSAAGAFVGAYLAAALSEHGFLLVAGAGLLATGLRIWQLAQRGARIASRSRTPVPAGRAAPRRVVGAAGGGFVLGVVGGVAGLILVELRGELFRRTLGLAPRPAAATNLAVGVLTGAAGLAGHGAHGQFDLAMLLIAGACSMLGAHFGAYLRGMIGRAGLMKTIGLLLLLVGAAASSRGLGLT